LYFTTLRLKVNIEVCVGLHARGFCAEGGRPLPLSVGQFSSIVRRSAVRGKTPMNSPIGL
jgi:hypothetical protein